MIAKVQKGQTPTLLNTNKANELIDEVNKIANLTIEYGDTLEILQGTSSTSIIIPRELNQIKKNQEQPRQEFEFEPITLAKKKIEICEDGIVKEVEFFIVPDEDDLADEEIEKINFYYLGDGAFVSTGGASSEAVSQNTTDIESLSSRVSTLEETGTGGVVADGGTATIVGGTFTELDGGTAVI